MYVYVCLRSFINKNNDNNNYYYYYIIIIIILLLLLLLVSFYLYVNLYVQMMYKSLHRKVFQGPSKHNGAT